MSNFIDHEVTFEPAPGKVVVEITDTEETYGKIIIPSTSRETRVIGTIHTVFISFTEGGELVEPWSKVGDIVIIGKFTGTEVTINRKKYVIMKETDILSKIK